MHLNSELLFRKYCLSRFKNNYKVLEIGPTNIPSVYQKIVNNPNIEWHTIDFSNTTYIGSSPKELTFNLTSPYDFPIKDEEYDIVLSGQVIEHVSKPWIWLKELKRIAKTNGMIFIINPVSWPYHEAPIDCWRIYPAGMVALAEETKLSVELSLFESLEKDRFLEIDPLTEFIPGRSFNYIANDNSISHISKTNRLLRRIPFLRKLIRIPIEVAYDCVTILKKKNERSN